MKKFFFLLLLLPFLGKSQPMEFSPNNIALNSIKFDSPMHGCAVGLASTILVTNDGGNTWVGNKSPVVASFNACGFADALNGWAVGSGGVIINTKDGGATWTQQVSGFTGEIRGISIISDSIAYAVGGGGIVTGGAANVCVILKTVDGGATWVNTIATIPAGFTGNGTTSGTLYYATLYRAFFTNENVGYVCGGLVSVPSPNGGGKVFKTTDGGATWTTFTTPTTSILFRSISFTADSIGWTCGSNGLLYKTTNAGANWGQVAIGATSLTLSDVQAYDANTTYLATGAGSRAIVRRTYDGGATWANDTLSATASTLSSVSFFGNTGYVCGGQGLIYKTTNGTTWTQKNGGQAFNPWDAHFVDANNGYIGCDGGRVAKTTDGGMTWAIKPTPSAVSLQGVWFKNINEGFAVGGPSGGLVAIKTTDAGNTWSAMTLPSGTTQQNDIQFIDAMNGYSVGSSGTVNRTTDGGTTWTAQNTTGSTTNLIAVHFIDPTNGWLVGLSGKIFKTVDGGATWVQQFLPNALTTTLNDVWFANASTGYICGFSGKAFKTVDGGTTWTELITGTSFLLADMEFFDADRGAFAGTNGTILYTEDGGSTFTPIFPNLTSNAISAIASIPGTFPTKLVTLHNSPTNAGFTVVRHSMYGFYSDGDGDGFGGSSTMITWKSGVPAGFVAVGGDCNDTNPAINPAATETCNSIDDNCNNQIDENGIASFTATPSALCTVSGKKITVSGIVAPGASAPYTYSKNGGTTYQTGATFSALTAGTYVIVVKGSNGCTASQSVVLAPNMSLTAVGSTLACNGAANGTATATAIDGTTPYSFAWSNGATGAAISGLSAGSYNVTATDANGCTKTKTLVKVLQPTAMAFSFLSISPKCNGAAGGRLIVKITGGTPNAGTATDTKYSLVWNNGSTNDTITNITAGSYSVTATDANGCTKVGTTVLAEPTPLVITGISSVPNGANFNVTLSATGGTPNVNWPTGYSYRRTPGNPFYATANPMVAVPAGTYTFEARDKNLCVSAPFTGTVPASMAFATADRDETLANVLQVYPNPASEWINIAFVGTTTLGDLFITDAAGRIVLSQKVSFTETATLQLPLATFAAGTYNATFVGITGEVANNAFVVTK